MPTTDLSLRTAANARDMPPEDDKRPLRILIAAARKTLKAALACLASSQHNSWYDLHTADHQGIVAALAGDRFDVHLLDPDAFHRLSDLPAELRQRVQRATILLTDLEAPGREVLSCFGHLPRPRLNTHSLDHLVWQLARQHRLDTERPPALPVFEVLLNLARMRLDAEGDLSAALRPLVEASAEAIGSGRVTIWAFRDHPKRLLSLNLYDRGPAAHSSGLEFPAALCPKYCMALEGHRILAIDDALNDPRCAELVPPYLSKVGIGALLDAPIYLDGQVVGLLCNAHFGGPRQWTEQEKTLAATFADYVQLVFMAHRRHQAEQALRVNQQALAAGQKMEALGRLASGLVHDFNNLLLVIGGNAQILERRQQQPAPAVPDPGKDARNLRNILDACSRAEHLARRLRSLGRQGTDHRQWVELGALLDESERLISSSVGPNIRVTVERHTLPVWVHIEPADLQSALINLASNARDAMAAGGNLDLSLRVEPVPQAKRGEARAIIAVRDNGPGMSAEVRERAFEPFFTTKGPEQGSGLGLWNVYNCLLAYGGSTEIDSVAGKGTQVSLILPATTEPPSIEQAPPRLLQAAVGTGNILVVDDDPEVRRTVQDMLEFLGYQVHAVGDAESAIATWRATAPTFDLILLDLGLPGMSGLDCFRALRAHDPGVVCVVMSAGADDRLVATCLAEGAASMLAKPFSLTVCAQTVQGLLTGTHPTPPSR